MPLVILLRHHVAIFILLREYDLYNLLKMSVKYHTSFLFSLFHWLQSFRKKIYAEFFY